MDGLLQQLDQIVETTLTGFEPTDAVFVAVGVLLLVFGRRLYWLALAGLGFAFALHLSREYLIFDSAQQELIVGVVVGLLGGLLAIFAQRLAIRIAGLVLGAWGAFTLTRILQPDADVVVAILVALAGALIGFLLAAKLFELALVFVTASVGAVLIVQHLHLDDTAQAVGWLVLALCGIALQLGRRKKKRLRMRMRPRDDA